MFLAKSKSGMVVTWLTAVIILVGKIEFTYKVVKLCTEMEL